MPIPAQRIIVSSAQRDFFRFGDVVDVPDLTEVQTRSYDRFLQLGVAFVVEREADKDMHSCRIIPERGSWIEINVTKKETLGVRIDQSGKFSALTLLRAMDPAYSSTANILKEFYPVEKVKLNDKVRAKLVGDPEANILPYIAIVDVIDPETGEVYPDAGKPFTN